MSDGLRSTRLFVYGTLRAGAVYHPLLAGARFERHARTGPGFTLVDLGPYPAMIARGRGSVAGEVYRVGPRTLAALDVLEEHPRLYVRRRIRLSDGSIAEAYVARPGWVRAGRRIPNGDLGPLMARRARSLRR